MALKNGAMSGKILGAGGGGFIMFITKNSQEKNKLIKFRNNFLRVKSPPAWRTFFAYYFSFL